MDTSIIALISTCLTGLGGCVSWVIKSLITHSKQREDKLMEQTREREDQMLKKSEEREQYLMNEIQVARNEAKSDREKYLSSMKEITAQVGEMSNGLAALSDEFHGFVKILEKRND